MSNGRQPGVLRHLRRLVAADGGSASDRDLLERFVGQRDEAAFAVLVRRHGPMVLGVCRRVLGDVHDAEDACQAAFLALARKADSIRNRASVGGWLHGVAYRVAANLKRQAARRHAREVPVVYEPGVEPAEPTWREVRAVLDEELARLPERLRAPLLLCYVEEKTRDEAAAELGWSVGTLRGRLERGRELLRGRLARRGITLSAALLAALLTRHAAGAALAAPLAARIVRGAALVAAGQTVAGAVPARVAALTEGALQTMFVTRLKSIVAVVVVLGVAGLGAAVLASGMPPAQPLGPGGGGDVRGGGAADEPPPRPGAGRAAEDAGSAVRRAAESRENLKQLALAMMNYADTHGGIFPPPALYGGTGGATGGSGMGGSSSGGTGTAGPGGPGGASAAPPGTGFGVGGGARVNPNERFNQYSGGKDVWRRSDIKDPATLTRFDRLAGTLGVTNGEITREQYVGLYERLRSGLGGGGAGGSGAAGSSGPTGGGSMGPGGMGSTGGGVRLSGPALLSWRVALLPYLGEEKLYRQFKLDEPWDGPHNRRLLEKMPAVYAAPGAPTRPPYATYYQVFVGPHAAFEKHRSLRLPADFPDGTSNTLLIVEAGSAVPWTKPEDLHYAADEPLPELGGLFPRIFNAACADGAVHPFLKKAEPDQLRRLITRDDGYPVDVGHLRAPLSHLETELRQENGRLKEELQRQRARLEGLQNDLQGLREGGEEETPETAELRKENARLRDSLEQLRGKTRQLEEQIRRLKETCDRRPPER